MSSRAFVVFFLVSAVCAQLCLGQGGPLCPVNSELRQCGSLCEPTCEKPEIIFCNPANPETCKLECRCLSGYVRNTATGECIDPSCCPK